MSRQQNESTLGSNEVKLNKIDIYFTKTVEFGMQHSYSTNKNWRYNNVCKSLDNEKDIALRT